MRGNIFKPSLHRTKSVAGHRHEALNVCSPHREHAPGGVSAQGAMLTHNVETQWATFDRRGSLPAERKCMGLCILHDHVQVSEQEGNVLDRSSLCEMQFDTAAEITTVGLIEEQIVEHFESSGNAARNLVFRQLLIARSAL